MTLTERRECSPLLKKVTYYFMIFLCFFIPLRSPIADLTFQGIKAIPDVIIVLLAFWYVISIRFRLKFKMYDIFFLAFLGTAFISTVFINDVGLMPYIFQVRSIGIYYILFYIARNMHFGTKEYIKLVRSLQIVALILFVFALIEKVSSKTLLFPIELAESIVSSTNFARVYSLLYNPNTFGLFIVLVLFASICIDFYCNVKTNVFIYISFAVSIFMSMSRSTLIILFVGLALILLQLILDKKLAKMWKNLIKKVVVIVVSMVLIVGATNILSNVYYENVILKSDKISQQQQGQVGNSLGVSTGDRLSEMGTSDMYVSSSVDGRIFSVTKSIEVFKDHPIFGTGFGTFGSSASMNYEPEIYEQYDIPFPFYSDIEYAKILAENGIVGVVLFAAFLLSILWFYRKDHFKLLICITIGWFGCFFNIFEVQIGAAFLWMTLSFVDSNIIKESLSLSDEKK